MAETENLSWIKIYSEELPAPTEWTVVDNDFDSDELSNEEISEYFYFCLQRRDSLEEWHKMYREGKTDGGNA